MKVSLGLLEVKGLALAIHSADAMAKSAAIRIADIERTNGAGWTVVKITGDVAAVQAAIGSGAALAEKFGGLISNQVLSRPDAKLLAIALAKPLSESLNANANGTTKPSGSASETLSQAEAEPIAPAAPKPLSQGEAEPVAPATASPSTASEHDAAPAPQGESAQLASCNLCHDPACPRKKGQPRRDCIHGGSVQ